MAKKYFEYICDDCGDVIRIKAKKFAKCHSFLILDKSAVI